MSEQSVVVPMTRGQVTDVLVELWKVRFDEGADVGANAEYVDKRIAEIEARYVKPIEARIERAPFSRAAMAMQAGLQPVYDALDRLEKRSKEALARKALG